MAGLLEHAVALREVSGLIPYRGGHKNLCGRREPFNYVSFCVVVKDNGSILLNTRYKAKNNTTTFPTNTLHVGIGSRSVPNRYRSFPPK